MADFIDSWPIEFFAGTKIRHMGPAILSQSLEIQRKIIFNLKNLLADISLDTQPSSTLDKYFHENEKPLHIVLSDPGRAPGGTRWICILCPNKKQIKTRTNDLRRHLEEEHLCEKSELKRVFNPKNSDRLWDYFGPCREDQASKNGWKVSSFENRKKKAKLASSSLASSALAGMKAPIMKGVESVKAMGKRKKSANSESELDSGLDSSRDLRESTKLDSPPQLVITNTDFDGSTIVPPRRTSSAAETFRSVPQSVYYSPFAYPAEPPNQVMIQSPSTDLLGLSGQFQGNHNGMTSETVQPDQPNSLGDNNFIADHFARKYGEHTVVPDSIPTTLNPADLSLEPTISPSQIQADNDIYNWDLINPVDYESFATLLDESNQQFHSNG